jgi:hypothetical protein
MWLSHIFSKAVLGWPKREELAEGRYKTSEQIVLNQDGVAF